MDELLVGYLLDALDPAERAAVAAHLAGHPADAAKLDRLRRLLRPLEADRGGYPPPPGLADATLTRLAAEWDAPPTVPAAARPRWFGRRHVTAAVAASVAVVAGGLLLSGVQKFRAESRLRACQNNLRGLHQSLVGYAEDRGGRLPRVGTPSAPVAGAFVVDLSAGGRCPPGAVLVCPAEAAPPTAVAAFRPDAGDRPDEAMYTRVGYAYTLGYRGPGGELVGLRYQPADPTGGYAPVLADYPAPAASPAPGAVSPHRTGQNVLFLGGHVRFTRVPTVGVGGDDIYRNLHHRVGAGLTPDDSSLGRATDRP